MIFLLLSRKIIFIFPENMVLALRRKMKDDLLKKIDGNMIFSSNVLKRWSFQKRPHWDMIFLVISGKMVFFPENMIFFPWAQSERRSFSRTTWKYDVFCVHVHTYGCYKLGATPLCQKKLKIALSCKSTPKGD